jgi:hypothetical protein
LWGWVHLIGTVGDVFRPEIQAIHRDFRASFAGHPRDANFTTGQHGRGDLEPRQLRELLLPGRTGFVEFIFLLLAVAFMGAANPIRVEQQSRRIDLQGRHEGTPENCIPPTGEDESAYFDPMPRRAAIQGDYRNTLYSQGGRYEINLHPAHLPPNTRYSAHSDIGQPCEKRGQTRPRHRHSYDSSYRNDGFSGGCPHSSMSLCLGSSGSLAQNLASEVRGRFSGRFASGQTEQRQANFSRKPASNDETGAGGNR